MKLEQLDLIKTSCKTCVFADYKENTQTGCLSNILQTHKDKGKVIEAYDNDKEFYVINGFCSFYRPTKWNNGKPDVELAKKELLPTFHLIINCNNLTEALQKNVINMLNSIEYLSNKIRISLFYDINQNKDTRRLILEILAIFQPKFLTNVSVCIDINEYMLELLKTNGGANYFCNIDVTKLTQNFSKVFDIISNLLINDNKKIIVASGFDQVIMLHIVYRYVYITNTYNNFEDVYNSALKTANEQDVITKID